MTQPVFTSGTWIAVFYDDGERRHWWDMFTKKGFRHCLAIRYLQPMDAWAIVDWANTGLFVDFVPKRFVDAIIWSVNEQGGKFLQFEVGERNRRMMPPAFLYCVSAVKELLGIRAFWILTPWQLYCALMKRGAKPMFDLSHLKEQTNGKRTQPEETSSATT